MARNYKELLQEIEGAISQCYRDTEDWLYSEEFITEELENMDQEFTKEGKQI